MISFIASDLRDWRERRMRKAICLSAILLAAVALVGTLQPLLLSLASVVVFLFSGWSEGDSPRGAVGARLDYAILPARARDLAKGKALSAFVVWLALALALSPILAASALAWGLSAGTIASSLLCWLAAYFLAASASFYSRIAFPRSEGILGLFVFVLWVLASFFVPVLKPTNPFVQAWSILMLEGGAGPYIGLCAEAAVAAALFAASGSSLGAQRRKRDA